MAKKPEEPAIGVGENAAAEAKEEAQPPQAQEGAQTPSEAQGDAQEPNKMLKRKWSDDEINEHLMAGGSLPQESGLDRAEVAKSFKEWEKPNLAALVGSTIIGVAESPMGGIGLIVTDANRSAKAVAWFAKEPLSPEPGFAYITEINR